MIVSNICFFGALIFLYQLAKLESDNHRTSERSLYYIALFPTAFIFMAVYTESVFLLFSVGCFYFARKRLWLWSGVLGALATATRFAGIFLYVAILLDWLYAQGWTLRTFFQEMPGPSHESCKWIGWDFSRST
jgi:Gpi18-like mannosyltransferase